MQIIIILETFKDFFSCKLSWPQIIIILKIFKDFFTCKLSSTQITIILKIFKDFFACNIVLDANHHYPGNFNDFFSCKLSWPQIIIILKIFKDFFSCKLSWPQIIIILKIFKDFFDCKIVLDANHHYPENIQRLFRLQKCLRRKSPLSWKYSNIFSSAKLSSTQITIILKTLKDFFACEIVFDANHHYPENIQRLFHLQYCLRCKSSISWKHSKTFSPAKLS